MRFVVVGSGKTAISVSKAIAAHESAELVGMIGDSRRETVQSSFLKQAEKLGVKAIAVKSLKQDPALSFLRELEPDYVISANNFMIFAQDALAIPKRAIVNFHNGPLPAYGGVNPFCWALMNGETSYGITWHLVDLGIDTGDLLVQEVFDIDPEDTALTLMIKCIELAISSFRERVLPLLVSGTLNPYQKPDVAHTYFTGKDVPYGGILPWWLDADALIRYGRAMGFAPLPNMFYRPLLKTTNGDQLYGARVEIGSSQPGAVPGTIIAADEQTITVATAGASLIVSELYKRAALKSEIPVNDHPIKVGDTLITET